MIAFRGNCQQIDILERLIGSNPSCILLDKDVQGAKLFEVQRDFDSQVVVKKYTYICKGGFFPKEQPISFYYNIGQNKGWVSTTRALVDVLMQSSPESKEIYVGNGDKP